jgi:hypothetical protein
MPPCASATICISMWRAFSMSFSTNSAAEPNAPAASPEARRHAASSSPTVATARIPLPPPPAAAFSITGYPMRSASRRA